MRAFPPEQRAAVLAWASELPAAADCPATRWSLDDLARRLVNEYADHAVGLRHHLAYARRG